LKKLSKQGRSNLLNGLVILFTLGLVLYLSAQGGDLGSAFQSMASARIEWILLAMGSWCFFMVFETLGLHVFFRQQKIKIKFGTSMLVTLIGSFYSSVTPAATGGQPMQVFSLKKRNVPTGISTSGLAVKFFTFQTALLTIGGCLWLFNSQALAPVGSEAIAWAGTGFFLNSLTVVAVILLAINKNIVRWIITLAIQLGKVLHIVKDVPKLASKADAAMQDFHASVYMLTHHPFRLFKLYLLSCMQVLGLMSVSYCIYKALGNTGASYLDVLTCQFLLYIAASFTPLPGASGAQEGGFLLFFGHLFPSQTVAAMLLWRFFTYYITLIIGFSAVMIDGTYNMRKIKKQKASRLTDTNTSEEFHIEYREEFAETPSVNDPPITEEGEDAHAPETPEASGTADAAAAGEQ